MDEQRNGPHPHGHEEEISLLQLLSVVLKHRRTILACTLGAGLVVGVLALRAPRTYTAQASFFPQGSEGSSGLGRAAALAGQFGISIPSGGEPGRSPQFYVDLLRTRELLSRVLADTFTVTHSEDGETERTTGTLLDLIEVQGRGEALRRERGIRWLRGSLGTTPNQGTGMVEIEVTTRWPELSFRIAERMLELLNEFNLQQRRSQAMAERSFIEGRLAEAREELRVAEEGLKRFLENNRQFQNSPELVFEHDRLQRQLTMRQEIVTSLSQAYEEARISEVRNTPVITVVERPETPPAADSRGVRFKVILGLVLGGIVGVFVGFARELLSHSRQEGDEDYRELRGLWEETVDEVRRPLRRLAGRSNR